MRTVTCVLALLALGCSDRKPDATPPPPDSVAAVESMPAPPPPLPLQADTVMARDTARVM